MPEMDILPEALNVAKHTQQSSKNQETIFTFYYFIIILLHISE